MHEKQMIAYTVHPCATHDQLAMLVVQVNIYLTANTCVCFDYVQQGAGRILYCISLYTYM